MSVGTTRYEAPIPERREIPLRRRRSLRLEAAGFRWVKHARRTEHAGPLQPYADITHIAVAPKAIWVGMRRDTWLLRRKHFEDPQGPEHLFAALYRAILAQPDGPAQWQRIAAVEERAAHPARRTATAGVVVVCLAVMALQWLDPFVTDVASFVPELVAHGEWWRAITGNLLHSPVLFPFHIASNLLLIVGFAFLVERPLGSLRTLLVMAAAGLGSMAASAFAGYDEVIGASGMAAGLVGAELALELRFGERLPASWRLSRPLFFSVLVLQAGIDLLIPFIAGAAHIGGFVVGYAMTLVLAPAAFAGESPSPRLRFAVAATLAIVATSLVVPLPLMLRDPAALSRHGRAVLASEDTGPGRSNDLAWRMLTESQLSPEQAQVAVALAERAVAETERQNPDILDTLAEALFVQGDQHGALEVIDEAIGLDADETYYIEQRRRYRGERAADDRPAPPAMPWFLRAPEEPALRVFIDPSNGVEI